MKEKVIILFMVLIVILGLTGCNNEKQKPAEQEQPSVLYEDVLREEILYEDVVTYWDDI